MLLVAAVSIIAAPAVFASIPRSTILTSTSIDFRTIEPVDVDASIDNGELLARALDRSFPASAPVDTLSESRVWVSRLERPLFDVATTPLSRSLRRGSAVAWPEVASESTVLTPDPLGYRDSSNLYAFAGGDPVNGRDPTGEAASVSRSGVIIGIGPDGSRYRIEPGTDPVVALRILESDADLGFDEQEDLLTRARMPIPYSSAPRPGEYLISSGKPNYRAFTHEPKGDNWVKNGIIATSGLPPQNRQQQIVQGGLQIAGTAAMVVGGTYGNASSVSAEPVTRLSTPGGVSAPIPLTLAIEQGWIPEPVSEGRWAPAEEGGRIVYWADNIFDPSTRSSWQDPATGRWKRGTNVERMADGLAPIGTDGKSVNLHHILQEEPGPLAEVPNSLHKELPHKLRGRGESFRNDPVLKRQFENYRREYWKQRSKDFQ